MKFGYARISTHKQSLESQIALLKKENCDKIFSDTISGYKDAKPNFDLMMTLLREGDEIIITGIDRLGRSTRDLAILLDTLHKKLVNLIIIGHDIDTRTASGRMIFNLMALVAENERMRNIERIHQGIACARAKGKQVGRPRKIDDSKIERLKQIYQQNTLSISEICLMYDISRPTLYKYLKNTEPRIKHENLRSTRHV